MLSLVPVEPIDYLVIGHVTQDVAPNGFTLGGTVSYASKTAKALGLRVGIVTAHSKDLVMPELDGIQISAVLDGHTSTFENINTPHGRIQYIHHIATRLTLANVPELWRNTPIVHIGPVCQETDSNMVRGFHSDTLIGITPQGWFRTWDENGRVGFAEWPEANYVFEHVHAVVLSIEDVRGNENIIEDFAAHTKILVVTEGPAGARVYWNGDLRRFPAPREDEVDPTGAGDIFATSFFIHLRKTRDPWEAARFANQLAALSVTRRGLDAVPTADEVKVHQTEILHKT